MRKKLILSVLATGLLWGLCGVVSAEWGDPVVVVNGGIGSGDNDFSLGIGDSTIDFSRVTDVSSAGEIAISDEDNGRVKIYRADGSLKHLLVPPVEDPKEWTYFPAFVGQNIVLPISNYYFYSADGQIIAQSTFPGRDIFSREINGRWYVANEQDLKKLWLEFSEAGELKTYTEKPLIMGRYRQNVIGYTDQILQQTTIEYPDMTWVRVDEDDGCSEYHYIRDGSGNVYCKLEVERKIKRFNACGRLVADFNLPDDSIEWEDAGRPGVEPYLQKINTIYGNIVLADNGDTYSSRVSDTSYQVLRWPWQASANDRNDGPFAPWRLTAKLEGESVKLNWLLSPQDAGCVTGYEVARATTAGGPYTTLTTVAKSIETYTDDTVQSGNTYYYAVRAISAIANSPYSNEVSAQAQ